METMPFPNHYLHNEDVLAPPHPQTHDQNNPTILVSWWCTVFSAVIILIRLGGRWVRTERLFLEDKIMALAIIPLFIRMGCVQVVLRNGTNNVITTGLSPQDIANRELGSKLVLAARIFYAMFLWIAKLTIADFLHRIYSQMWTKKHDLGLRTIRYFLILTFIGVVIATLAECQPFDNYWQVVPDPGKACRAGDAQLISMGVLDAITDLLLVIFPLPIIFTSTMKLERKISLSLLFSMSLILVGITSYRVQATIAHHYEQRFRSLLASFEILAATGVANAIVLGSFLRDRGLKKNKFKFSSTNENTAEAGSVLDRPALARTRSNQPQTQTHARGMRSWGSDVDLVGDYGMRLGPEFHSDKPRLARPAPAVLPLQPLSKDGRTIHHDWAFDAEGKRRTSLDDQDDGFDVHDPHADFDEFDSEPGSPMSPTTPGGMNFFDVGGLLDKPMPGPSKGFSRRRRQSSVSFAPLPSANSLTPLVPPELRGDSPPDSAESSPVHTQMPRSALKGGRETQMNDLSIEPAASRSTSSSEGNLKH